MHIVLVYIPSPFLRIGQHLVRLLDNLKALLCLVWILWVLVGMPAQCRFTIGHLDGRIVCITIDLQHLVVAFHGDGGGQTDHQQNRLYGS